MSDLDAQASCQLVPVSVVTGFLGSGKTTLLNHLLCRAGLRRTAVIINEFGEICLDHPLFAAIRDEIFVMRSGCLCCTLRGDLIDCLCQLMDRRLQGEIAPFDRVIFETTGLADPAPIIQTLICHPWLNGYYRLDSVATTVDALNAERQLDCQPESVKQVALADHLVVTKTDLTGARAMAALTERLRRLNPRAPMIRAVQGQVAPECLFGIGPFDPTDRQPNLRCWLGTADDPDRESCGEAVAHCERAGDAYDGGGDRHQGQIRTFALASEAPLVWERTDDWLGQLIGCYGEDLLRVKGLLNLAGVDAPVVIHGVQHLFHQPIPLPAWPTEDRRSLMVFVVRDIARTEIEAGFRACALDHPGRR
ncbi:MAG: CobW family GTP-binding protein [Kiloniellales bacterium]